MSRISCDAHPRRVIVFCHGVRERTLAESGGYNALGDLFDEFIDTSAFMKPWEAVQPYTDWVRGDRIVCPTSFADFQDLLSGQDIDYILLAGLERSIDLLRVARLVENRSSRWGILFVRGDLKDLFDGRRYDHALPKRWTSRAALAVLRDRVRSLGVRPDHLFTHEKRGCDFSELPSAKRTSLINHRDYYSHVQHKESSISKDAGGIVFIDQALPHVFRVGLENQKFEQFYDRSVEDSYYGAVSDYLAALQDETGLRARICLHPNTPVDRIPNYTNAIEIVSNDTIGAISDSDVVVTHTSSATGICHVLEKPTVLLNLADELLPQRIRNQIPRKAVNEGLVVHNWLRKGGALPAPMPARSSRVKNFICPNPNSHSLAVDLKRNVVEHPIADSVA